MTRYKITNLEPCGRRISKLNAGFYELGPNESIIVDDPSPFFNVRGVKIEKLGKKKERKAEVVENG
ncbi:MAG: hypothetical protein DRJ46_02045 [Thermoprotei archaeon]|nr:MAG: hypothetical protein DRJ46_02045 [Thermoprotei archaeon]